MYRKLWTRQAFYCLKKLFLRIEEVNYLPFQLKNYARFSLPYCILFCCTLVFRRTVPFFSYGQIFGAWTGSIFFFSSGIFSLCGEPPDPFESSPYFHKFSLVASTIPRSAAGASLTFSDHHTPSLYSFAISSKTLFQEFYLFIKGDFEC